MRLAEEPFWGACRFQGAVASGGCVSYLECSTRAYEPHRSCSLRLYNHVCGLSYDRLHRHFILFRLRSGTGVGLSPSRQTKSLREVIMIHLQHTIAGSGRFTCHTRQGRPPLSIPQTYAKGVAPETLETISSCHFLAHATPGRASLLEM
jgi:hypothetical protein